MAKVNINGKLVGRPGVYTLVRSGIRTTPPNLPYGKVLIIDDGIGAGWGGGDGGVMYKFNNVQDFQNFVKGGELWNIGQPLFKPILNSPGVVINGASEVAIIHARTATAATIAFTIASGNCSFVTKDKGLNANGVEDGTSVLRKGYSGTIEQAPVPANSTFVTTTTTPSDADDAQVNTVVATNINPGAVYSVTFPTQTITKTYTAVVGDTAVSVYTALAAQINADATLAAIVTASVNNGLIITATADDTPFNQTSQVTQAPARFIFKFWHGSFKGIDPLNNTPYEGISESNATPFLLAESTPVATLDELSAWAQSDSALQAGFVANIGTGAIVVGDLASNVGNVLAAGATESYTPAAFQAALELSKGADNNFFLSGKYRNDAIHENNDAIVDQIVNSKYERFLIIGGGADTSEYSSISKAAAKHFNSDKVHVIHGDGKKTIRNGFKRVSSFWKSANYLGRLCGLEPQTPITYKQLGIDAEWEQLSDDMQEQSIDDGVLVSFFDDELGYDVVLKGINTLQNNQNLVNEDGTSPSTTVKRITAQLNKEAAIYLKKKFFGNANVGPNRNTITEEDIRAALEGYLQSRVASSNADNLILRFGNITVTIDQDIYRISYEFVPNFEVSILVVTGIILEN